MQSDSPWAASVDLRSGILRLAWLLVKVGLVKQEVVGLISELLLKRGVDLVFAAVGDELLWVGKGHLA